MTSHRPKSGPGRSAPPSAAVTPTDAHLTVEAIMARLAAGDQAAIFTLFEFHGHRVAGVVRRQLRACGVEAIAGDELDALVLDACMELRDVAGAWHPGGALPWWWAEGRIRSVVNGWVGIHADSIDDHWKVLEAGDVTHAASEEESIATTFARLVAEVPIVGRLAEAAAAAKVDEASLLSLLDYSIQQRQGDPSPATTLAVRSGISPETMRKRISRSRARLRGVVEGNPRYADLADFVFVA